MKKSWWRTGLVSTLAIVLVVSAATSQQAVRNPDTFVYDNIGQPDTLDPSWAFDTASYVVIEQLYEPLITYDGGATNKFKSVLAESFSISNDGLTYTFKIRQGVKFHDGTPLTPEDVAYSFHRLFSIDRDGGSGFVVLVPILGVGSTRDENGNLRERVTIRGREVPLEEAICNAVQVKGDSVVFNLAQPFAPWLQILAGGQSHIISKQFTLAQAKAQNKVEFPGCPITRDQLKQINNPENESKLALFNVANGTGPFRLINWDQAQKIVTMARNDNYWGTKANFKNLIFKEVPEFTTRLLELRNGDADVIDAGQRANVPQILTTDNVLVVDDLPGLVVASMFFNFDIKVKGQSNPLIGSGACDGKGIPPDFFRDVNVRKAFAFSFDHDKYIRDIFLGKAVTPATPDIKGLPFHDPKVEGIRFDRDKARAAFADAKCGGTSVSQTGFTFTIRYNTGNLARQAAANLLKTDVESFNRNFRINVEGVPFSEILNQIDSGELPMWILGWAPDFIDDADYVNQWMGSSGVGAAFSGPGSIDKLPEWGKPGKTPGGIEYKNWDDLLLKAQSDPNDARRRDMYSHLQKLFVDNAVAIMLSQPTVFFVQRTWLDGYRYNPGDPGNVFNVLTAYSKKADALPNVSDLCANYPTVTFHFGPKDTVKTCKDFGK